jgi:flagellar assembly protein FliH
VIIGLATTEADELLNGARQQAAELIRAAQEEAERIRIDARIQGEQEARAEWEQERACLGALALAVSAAYQRFCREQVSALAELATRAAEKLLGEQLACEPERVLTIVHAAMEQVSGSTHVALRLNPADIDLVQPALASTSCGHAPAVQIHADPTVERGGCWIESEQGKVDATVSGRLAELEAAMGDE